MRRARLSQLFSYNPAIREACACPRCGWQTFWQHPNCSHASCEFQCERCHWILTEANLIRPADFSGSEEECQLREPCAPPGIAHAQKHRAPALPEAVLRRNRGLPEAPEAPTPNGYDPLWVRAINHVLEDRESPIRIDDVTEAQWEEFIGPLVDAIENTNPEPREAN